VAAAVGVALLPLPIALGARMATEVVPARRGKAVVRTAEGAPREPHPPPLLDMVQVRGGSFWMGSRVDDARAYLDERPRHRVEVAPFWIGRYVVTQAEYRKVVEQSPGAPLGDDLPVNNVSWFDAVAFCNALSRREGYWPAYEVERTKVTWIPEADGYRLPTEVEWEYAARAGTETAWSFGDDEAQLGEYAWYAANSGGELHPVGEKKPNLWGLYDMHGNVYEWCWGWDGSYPTSPPVGSARVLRGGSFLFGPGSLRSAGRDRNSPDVRHERFGFRVARGSVRQP
jgi:formylglycine-generating enzyme required for sulfatase activity